MVRLHREAPELTVVCQRASPGPALPSQLSVVSLPDGTDLRPLHVKVGLVRFEQEEGSPRPLVRAYIGSTNLTGGGFGGNLETLVWTEDAKGKVKNGMLQVVISGACREVAAAAGPKQSELEESLDKLLAGFHEPAVPSSALRHTINNTDTDFRRTRLLGDVPHPDGFDRLDVVSPPYWQPHTGSRVADELVAVLPPQGGTVRLLTCGAIGDTDDVRPAVAFPESLVRALESEGLNVQPGVIGELHDGQRRPLHAKMLLLHGAQRSTVVLGSANATVSGLGGKNREAVVLLDLARQHADELVDAVGPWRTDIELDEGALEDRQGDQEATETMAGIVATFVPAVDDLSSRSSGRYLGVLVVRGFEPCATVRIVLGERCLDLVADEMGHVDVAAAMEQGLVELDLRRVTLFVEIDGRLRPILVTFDAPQDWLDVQIARLDAPPRQRALRHPLEQLLFRDLRRVQQRRHQEARAPGAYTAAGDDRLSLPIDRRLQVLLRFRRSAPHDLSEEIIADYLDAADVNDPRVQVARAALQPDVVQDTNDPLITALRDALRLAGEEAETP